MKPEKRYTLSPVILVTAIVSVLLFNILWIKTGGLSFSLSCEPSLWSWSIFFSLIISVPSVFLRKSGWISFIIIGITDLFFISNLMYYDTFGSQIPLGSYSMVHNLKGFYDAVTDNFHLVYFLFPAVLIAGILVFTYHKLPQISMPVWLSGLAVSLLAAVISFNYPERFSISYNRLKLTHEKNSEITILYSPFTLLTDQYINGNETELSKSEIAEIAGLIENNKSKLKNRSNCRTINSVVIIILESFESFVIDLMVEGIDITPNMSRLAHGSTSLYVKDVVPETGAARSMDAQLLINCGLIPPENEAFCFIYPGNYYPSLAKELKRNGKGTVSISVTSDFPSTYNQKNISASFGYDMLLSRKDYITVPESALHVDDSVFFAQSEALLENNLWRDGESAIIQVVSYSCHTPFRIPANSGRIDFKGVASKLSRYYNVIHRTDAAVGRFVRYLEQRGDYDSTLIVITGDHNVFPKSKYKALGIDKLGVSHPAVPLIILNSPECGELPYRIHQSDIYPTILELLGLDRCSWAGIGKSAFNTDSIGYDAKKLSNYIIKYDMLRKISGDSCHTSVK